MISWKAVVERVYGPFVGRDRVNGVTFDGQHVWFASGPALVAFDPESGKESRSLSTEAHAGTAFDGRYLYQVAEGQIRKLDPKTGEILAVVPAPGDARPTGLAWAEGSLWLGQYDGKKILKLDPKTGEVLGIVTSDRFVTGVTFDAGELWHGASDGKASELRRVEPASGAVLEKAELPEGFSISGLEADGAGRFYCGGGGSGKVLAIARPRARSA